LAQLARVIDDSGEDHDPAISVNADGTLLPIFAITASVDDGYIFRHIAAHSHPEQPFIVLTVPGAANGTSPTVEELAAIVCRNIRAVRPHGPYLLGGYCFGGLLAFEAAQQLIAAGERVDLLALIDTPTPGYPKISNSGTRYRRELRHVFSGALGLREVMAHARTVGRLVGKRAAARTQQVMVSTGISQGASIEMTARLYVPRSIDTDVALIMAGDDVVSTRVLEDPRLGWRDLARNFEVHRVPGKHGTVLAEANAASVAKVLSYLVGQDRLDSDDA
jgi:thioesterase domain-containing protein